jgi:hypothetical protein
MRRVWGLWLAAFLMGGSAAGVVSCAETESQRSEPAIDCGVGRPVVNTALLAFLSKAKSAHHQADLAEEDGDLGAAVSALAQLIDGPVPGGDKPAPEAREVLADTLARMAELESSRARFEEGIRMIDRGLVLAVERTHFRGRLMEVRGVVEQRLHDRLRDDGDDTGAKAAKERAIAAFQEAIAIQDEVIQNSLGDLEDSLPDDPP